MSVNRARDAASTRGGGVMPTRRSATQGSGSKKLVRPSIRTKVRRENKFPEQRLLMCAIFSGPGHLLRLRLLTVGFSPLFIQSLALPVEPCKLLQCPRAFVGSA